MTTLYSIHENMGVVKYSKYVWQCNYIEWAVIYQNFGFCCFSPPPITLFISDIKANQSLKIQISPQVAEIKKV